MSFPNLALIPGGREHSTGTGVPSDGNNTIDIGFQIQNTNFVCVTVVAAGASIQDVTLVSLSGSTMVLNFQQNGADEATVEVAELHTLIR